MSALARLAPAARRLALRPLPRIAARAAPRRPACALACAPRDDVARHAVPLDAPCASRPHADAVVSLVGADRVGLIRSFSAAAAAADAHVVQSRMALLGADFAIAVHVRLPGRRGAAAALEGRLRRDFPGFDVAVRTTHPDTGAWRQRWSVWLEGPDSTGLTAAVSEEIEAVAGNVMEMQMKVEEGVARMAGALEVAEGKIHRLAERLGLVEDRFGVRIGLRYVAGGAV